MSTRSWAGTVASVAVAGAALTLSGAGVAYAGTTTGNGGIGSGNQVYAPITLPIDICGNTIDVLGIGKADCGGDATVSGGAVSGGAVAGRAVAGRAGHPARVDGWTSGAGGIGSGNQISVPIRVPVDICGNALAILGTAKAGCSGKPQPPCHEKWHPRPCPPKPCPPKPCHCRPGHHQPAPPAKPHSRHPSRPHRSSPAPAKPVTLTAGSPQRAGAVPVRGILPITGVNLEGLGSAAVALLGTGVAALFGARRRKSA